MSKWANLREWWAGGAGDRETGDSGVIPDDGLQGRYPDSAAAHEALALADSSVTSDRADGEALQAVAQHFLAVMAAHFRRQRDWSLQTFGPGNRALGVLDHIRRELLEIEADPTALEEWIDVAILAFDGAWRAGHEPETIAAAWLAKQRKNERRDWPDWRKMPTDRAIEHVRTDKPTAAAPPNEAA